MKPVSSTNGRIKCAMKGRKPMGMMNSAPTLHIMGSSMSRSKKMGMAMMQKKKGATKGMKMMGAQHHLLGNTGTNGKIPITKKAKANIM